MNQYSPYLEKDGEFAECNFERNSEDFRKSIAVLDIIFYFYKQFLTQIRYKM
jgi:hypothetical protein